MNAPSKLKAKPGDTVTIGDHTLSRLAVQRADYDWTQLIASCRVSPPLSPGRHRDGDDEVLHLWPRSPVELGSGVRVELFDASRTRIVLRIDAPIGARVTTHAENHK